MVGTVVAGRPTTHRAEPLQRRQRRDVQGLRGIAVAFVVLFHAGVRWLPGGYVGVDMFFVISGFVITGSLLDHRTRDGSVSILRFYGRRAQRILPMAAITLVTVVVAAYTLLGFVQGARAARDATWSAVFLSNVHQAESGSTYLGSQLEPSLLQHFWSLAVEEQFYLAWPLIVGAASFSSRASWRRRLAAATIVLIVISLAWSVISTAQGGSWPYFSPFTRAWELGVGAFCALAAHRMSGLSSWMRTYVAVVGSAACALAAITFSDTTPFPGLAAALPVAGAACLLIAGCGGSCRPVSVLLGNGVVVLLGDISYSLYLWHWPLLVVPERMAGHPLGAGTRAMLVVTALALSVVTYHLIERPWQRAQIFRRRPWFSVATGALLVGVVLVTATVAVQTHPRVSSTPAASDAVGVSDVTAAQVESSVTAAADVIRAPADLTPAVGSPGDRGASSCSPQMVGPLKVCVSGDMTSSRVMAVDGDSHADEWTYALSPIAAAAHLKLVSFALPSCPAPDIPLYSFTTNAPNAECDAWHAAAPRAIASLRPSYVILTSSGHDQVHPDRSRVTSSEWETGLRTTIAQVRASGTKVVVLGDYAYLPQPAPECVAAHIDDVRQCSTSVEAQGGLAQRDAERRAAQAEDAEYIDTMPWVCSDRCTAVIGSYLVYKDSYHLSAAYTEHLSGLLATRLGLGRP